MKIRIFLPLLFAALVFSTSVKSQNYIPFPNESGQWNCFYFTYVPNMYSGIGNYHYVINGDTTINTIDYKKIYFEDVEWPNNNGYFGAIREENQNIYFFPQDEIISYGNMVFPNTSEEHLLYSFNNLSVGMELPINDDDREVLVVGIDSMLFNESIRKVYYVNYIRNGWVQMTDAWIEGIGSIYELFNPFIDWFPYETDWYTLCHKDDNNETFYINSPNGEDSCHYYLNVGINELMNQVSIYPNPVNNLLKIDLSTDQYANITILNLMGQMILIEELHGPQIELELTDLETGIYFIEVKYGEERIVKKFIKE